MKRFTVLFLAVVFGTTLLSSPVSALGYDPNKPPSPWEAQLVLPSGDDSGWGDPTRSPRQEGYGPSSSFALWVSLQTGRLILLQVIIDDTGPDDAPTKGQGERSAETETIGGSPL